VDASHVAIETGWSRKSLAEASKFADFTYEGLLARVLLADVLFDVVGAGE
jgi:hypothetical protein